VGGYVDLAGGIQKAPASADPAAPAVKPFYSVTAAAWLCHSFGQWTLDTQGSVLHSDTTTYLIDLDRLVLAGLFPAEAGGARSFGVQAGRIQVSDATGYVLNHRLDGLKLTVGRASSAFSAGFGTTALLQKPTSSVIMSALDVASLSDAAVVFAAPRFVASFEYEARGVLAGQDVILGAVVQEDLRPEDQLTPEFQTDPAGGGAMDTQYLSLILSGGLIEGLYHRTFYTLNSGRTLTYRADPDSITGYSFQYTPILGHLAGLELTYFLPELLNSRVRVSGLFSSGDLDAVSYFDGNTNEKATAFVPISASAYSDVFTLQPGNSSHLALSYSLRPLSGIGLDILQTELKSVMYFRTAGTGPVSDGAVDEASDGTYVGTDINLKVVVQPFSDLRVVVGGGFFLPNAAVMTTDNQNVDYQFTLQGVLRF
jgi:hypothetical protein